MNIVSEVIFIGIYTHLLYLILTSLGIFNLFTLGFLKHFLGYLFLHNYYCNHGVACKKQKEQKQKFTVNNYIIVESILEGILFVFIGRFSLFKNVFKNVFTIGVFLHILFELLNIHKVFCELRCKIK